MVYWWPEDRDAERLAESYENASGAYFVSQANVELSRRQFGSPLGNAKVVRNLSMCATMLSRRGQRTHLKG